jgi:hypothetical protein
MDLSVKTKEKIALRIKCIFLVIFIICLAFLFCCPYLLLFNKIIFEDAYLEACAISDLNLIYFSRDGVIPLWAYHFGGD